MTRLARGGSRGAYGPSRQVRTALDDRQTFAPVSLVALGPGAAPHTGPSCAQNPAQNAPVYPKASAQTLGGGPVCGWTVYGSCRGSWPGSSSHLTQTEGGCQEKRRVCVRQPHSVLPCVCSCCSSCTGRDVTRQPTRRGRERPPLFCRWRGSSKGAVSAQVSGTVSDPTTRQWSRSRPYVSLREGSTAAPAGRTTPAGAPGRSTAHNSAGGRLES